MRSPEILKVFVEHQDIKFIAFARRAIPDTNEQWAKIRMRSITRQCEGNSIFNIHNIHVNVLTGCGSTSAALIRPISSGYKNILRKFQLSDTRAMVNFSDGRKFN